MAHFQNGVSILGEFFLERGANLESQAAHTHPKNTQVPPRVSVIVLEVTSPQLKTAQEKENKTLKRKSKTAQKRYTIDETH